MVRSESAQDSLEGTLPDHIEAEFNEELWDGGHAARLQAASLVIGLHPDQAGFSFVCMTFGNSRSCFLGFWKHPHHGRWLVPVYRISLLVLRPLAFRCL